MIYPFGIVMEQARRAAAELYQLYLANPLCNAVLLNNRAFWIRRSPSQPGRPRREELPAHLFERGAIFIVARPALLWLAQVDLRAARGPIRGEALMADSRSSSTT